METQNNAIGEPVVENYATAKAKMSVEVFAIRPNRKKETIVLSFTFNTFLRN